MTKPEIIEKVNSFLIDRLEVDPSVVNPNAELRRDMGLTSIDAVHTMLFLKQEYDNPAERRGDKFPCYTSGCI